jgi:hypothetical protein
VSLEIIRKLSIKPSPESPSIYVPGDPASAQVPPPDPGATASELKEAAGQSSVAGSTKDTGAAGSTPAPPTGQSDEAGMTTDPGAAGRQCLPHTGDTFLGRAILQLPHHWGLAAR